MFFRVLAAAGLVVAAIAVGHSAIARNHGPYGGWGMMGNYGMGADGFTIGGAGSDGYGPQAMFRHHARLIDGASARGDLKLTVEAAKARLERRLAASSNPRLKVGEVKEIDADTIRAEIVTRQENALVQILAIDRHSGVPRPTGS